MKLDVLIERTQELREALPDINLKQRLAQAAQGLNMAASNQARIELLTEAVLALTRVLYETDSDGVLANVDRKIYRLLIPAPWGHSGWKKWGLREWEGGILRKIMIVRGQMARTSPLFDYNDQARTWHINMNDYPRLDRALAYWKAQPLTMREWRLHADIYRAKAAERTQRNG